MSAPASLQAAVTAASSRIAAQAAASPVTGREQAGEAPGERGGDLVVGDVVDVRPSGRQPGDHRRVELEPDHPQPGGRRLDHDRDGVVETWRLGDIVYATPVAVDRPAENFDLLYRDAGYREFARRYRDRRRVVYVGANDGMLHAFNADTGTIGASSPSNSYSFNNSRTSNSTSSRSSSSSTMSALFNATTMYGTPT